MSNCMRVLYSVGQDVPGHRSGGGWSCRLLALLQLANRRGKDGAVAISDSHHAVLQGHLGRCHGRPQAACRQRRQRCGPTCRDQLH